MLVAFRDHWVTAADEGRTLVLFHPERPFPYEHSLPIPRQESLVNEGDSVLKVQYRLDQVESEAAKDKTDKYDIIEKTIYVPRHKFYPQNL